MATEFYTFWTLLENPEIRQVQIPLIQRDYAQGRKEEKVNLIRHRFVGALYEAVADQRPLVLDFVYGERKEGVFVPLDGQQRLTTLFLLHWYLALAEGQLLHVQPLLAKFTYETRINSREFCRALVAEAPPERTGFGALSEAIENMAWFRPAWKRDPTVTAMMTMLDELEDRFGNPTGWLARLTDPAQALVGFYFLDMPATGLSDDLYLKMNARGKALTEFENWKAEFDLFLQRQHPTGEARSLQQEFGQKLDGPWTDFFWQHRQNGTGETDEAVERYLHYVTRMLAYQRSATGEHFSGLTRDRLPFALFEQVYQQPEAVRFLFDTLDFLATVSKTAAGLAEWLGGLLSEQAAPNRVRLFGERANLVEQCLRRQPNAQGEGLLRGQLTRQGEVLLFGLLSLAAATGGQVPDEENARELLRVLRNLLERRRQQNNTKLNSDLRASDLAAFAAAIQVMVSSPAGTYNQLDAGVSLPTLDDRNVAYEREKATLLARQPALKPVLHTLEDYAVLHGDLHNLRLPEHIDQAAGLAQAVGELWPETNPLPQELLIRAWLTRGDYRITQWHWTQLGHKYFFGNQADWYTILATDRVDPAESLLPDFLQAYVAAAGHDARQKLTMLIDEWLAKYVDKSNWRYYFIKYPEMTARSTGYYAWNSDFTPRLLRSDDLRGKHINPYVRTVVMRGLVKGAVAEYQEVNGKNESPLRLQNIAGVPAELAQPEVYCEEEGWRLVLATGCTPDAELVTAHNLQPAGPEQWWLLAANTHDRIEQVEALVTDLQRLGVRYQEPEIVSAY